MKIIKEAKNITYNNNYYSIKTNNYEVRLWFLTNKILRIRVGFSEDFSEESYTLVTTAWQDRLDEYMKNERTKIDVTKTSMCEENDSCTISTEALNVVINKNPFQIKIYDLEDELLHSDIVDLAYRLDSNGRIIHTQEIFENDCFFGFGEKTGTLDKSKQLLTMCPNDTMGYDAKMQDSLYKHIPFYIRANKKTSKACGYFYHNTHECTFDLGRSHSNYFKHHSTYMADGGDIDLFFMAGPSIKQVVKQYTFLTGRSTFLPKYSLGYLGSSMYYSELSKDCDKAILNFIETANKESIPIDGFQLSSGYTAYNTDEGEKRCVFTWNNERFSNPKEFFNECEKKGITVSPNVKPGILLSHKNIDEFMKKDIFVKKSDDALNDDTSSDNNSFAIGNWWGGKGIFADFTNPECRDEWKRLLKENVLKKGTTSVWNDNCEYDSIIDKDSKICFDGKGSTIKSHRTIMPNLMCKITKEAIEEESKNIRPFIVCRSGHSGIQRYAQSWAGDNNTSWESLRYNISTILGMSMCGVSNYGCDIGGFYGKAPSPELLVRWVQNGIFMPRFSIHSVNTDNTVTEPWMYPSYKKYIADAIKLRYRLFPYYYSLMKASSEKGDMILNPLFATFPNDEKTYNDSENFIVGNGLLVANILEENTTSKNVYLPYGSNYYDFKSMKKFEGGKTIEIDGALSNIPMFLLSGAILPLADNQMYNIKTEEVTDLNIICVADKNSSFTYYEDDGISYDYIKGAFHKMHINMTTGTNTEISFTHEGIFSSSINHITLSVVSPNNCPLKISINEEELPQNLYYNDFVNNEKCWYYDIEKNTTIIKYPYNNKNHNVNISYENFDMLGM